MKRGMYFILTVCLLLCGTAASAVEPYFAKVSVTKDSTTGYDVTCVNVNGHNTARAYFTQGMWTSDSKRLILSDNQDGYLYEYNVETTAGAALSAQWCRLLCDAVGRFVLYSGNHHLSNGFKYL